MNELQVFNFEGSTVRTLMLDEAPWWVLSDVCKILEIANSRNVTRRLDDDEKGVHLVDTPSGFQQMTIVNEYGLYETIFRSDKEVAKRFRRWVTHEVLPAIRKTGAYSITPKARALTTDDYMKAAQLAATCRNERLPYVLGFLEQAGFNIPEVTTPPQADDGPIDCTMIQKLMDTAGITQDELSRRTNICKASLSYYRRGIHKPSRERYQIIINALT